MKDLRDISVRGNDNDDGLDLVPEALKDLTVAMARAKQVGGGSGHGGGRGDLCEGGTM